MRGRKLVFAMSSEALRSMRVAQVTPSAGGARILFKDPKKHISISML